MSVFLMWRNLPSTNKVSNSAENFVDEVVKCCVTAADLLYVQRALRKSDGKTLGKMRATV